MRTHKYSEVTARYRPINIPICIPEDSPSWKPQWLQPESAVSSNVPVDNVNNEYSGYSPEGEGSFAMLIDILAKIMIILHFLIEQM